MKIYTERALSLGFCWFITTLCRIPDLSGEVEDMPVVSNKSCPLQGIPGEALTVVILNTAYFTVRL